MRKIAEQFDRPVPHNAEAEQAILGGIILEPSIIDQVLTSVQTSAFYIPQHRKIYVCIKELAAEESPIDLILLVNKLTSKGWLTEVGGMSYVSGIADAIPTVANISHYIDIVNEKFRQREIIAAANEITELAFDTEDASQTLAAAQNKLEQLSGGNTKSKEPRRLGNVLQDCYEDLEQKYLNRDGTGINGMPSGFGDLDRMTGGFQNSDLVIIGARPSVGKTAFALNISRNAAKESKKTVALFSLEMSEKQLGNRMLSAEAHIDGIRLRSGHLEGEDWEKLTIAIAMMDEYPILIDDSPGLTVMEIRAKCRKLAKEHDLGMIVIDYLQLIESMHRSGINRQQEITEISRALKIMAKELNVPVIALSQLSRALEQRQDKRPMMSDLRESGAIEQDADIVAFLYRDDYYDKETEKKNIIEIIIAKQRNGPVGTVELAFIKKYNKFLSLEQSSAA